MTETDRGTTPPQLARIAGFIWGIADDVLRDLYVRGKYRDVILPMTVLRRFDAVLEPTKQAVLEHEGVARRRRASSTRTARCVTRPARPSTTRRSSRCATCASRTSQQQLRADFEAYLDGFSPNVQDILEAFEFRNQIPRLSRADAIGTLIEKFLDPTSTSTSAPATSGLDNHAMGTRLRGAGPPLQRGEQRGGRRALDASRRGQADGDARSSCPSPTQIESGTYLIYDGACGTGGMLTVAEETLLELAAKHGKEVSIHLYGQEINAETYAICKADLLLKGEGEAADNIVGGPEHSTLANDAFPSREFDFMLSNPPYGKSWKSDLERMGGKDGDEGSALRHRARRRPRVLARDALERRADAVPRQPASRR